MPQKFPGAHLAVGYWARSPWCRIESEQIPAKIRVLLQDKLIARGQPAWLYQPVEAGDTDVFACTCVKNTSQSNDRPCQQCYGVGLVPGYQRFMSTLVHFSVAEFASYTLSSVERRTDFKPHHFRLVAGAVTGTIITQDKAFTNPAPAAAWATDIVSYIRAAGNTVTAEFSTDSGATWTNVTSINGPNQPVGTGVISFRITLTRSLAGDASPVFEMIRARHIRVVDYNDMVSNANPLAQAGQILVERPWIQEQAQSDTGRGVTIEWMGDRSWTAPLDFFDTTITLDTLPARIDDDQAGPHPFYEYAHGIKTGKRVVMTSFKWNEEFGVFTHQSFDERVVQTNEHPYSLVF